MKNAVTKRGIKYVWHFTRLENLDSILLNGIVPRSVLEEIEADVCYNDACRLDGQKGASCFSIAHPNYKMFYALRQQNLKQEWVVIACESSILWLKDCAFCYENAASNNVTAIALEDRKGIYAFENLFSPAVGKPSREELKLPADCPTNPQAEVLIFGTIEPQYIVAAACQSAALTAALKVRHPDSEIVHVNSLFSARLDYAHWK